MSAHAHVPGLTTARLHLLLALLAVLTGTTQGLLAATAVLAVLGARSLARHRLATASGAVGARVLAAPQHTPVLDPARAARQRLAG